MTLPRCRSLLFLITRARNTRRPPQTRLFFTLSRIEYGATLSFRHSHSFTDVPETTQNATREHPIDIIEGETAIRRLRQHVEDGKYLDARNILADFVQNHELGGNLGLFRELRDIITTTDNANMKLLVDLGLLLARRGHVRFVRDEIRPLFEDDDMLASFNSALAKIVEWSGATRCAPSVFEEPSEDYILPASAPASPSIADLVRATLPEILPQSAESDTSLFEDSDVEYPLVNTVIGMDAAHRNTYLLDQLITSNASDQAFAMLQEMQSLGSPIAPSVAFGNPAEKALRAGKTDEFLSWLAHVPPHREGDMAPYFQRIQGLLLQKATLDCPLLKNVIMLLAGKEYRPIVQRCTQAIVRDTKSLSELETFLREVEEQVFRYYQTEDPSLAQDRRQRYVRFLRGVAVRVCSWEGRFQDALALLPGDSDQNLFLTPPTYQVLLKKLAQTKQRQWIHTVQECEARDLARLKAYHGDEYAPFRDRQLPTTISPPADINDIDGYTQFLHEAIERDPKAMHPHIVANFMTSYVRQGYPVPGTLRDLTEHAVRTSYGAMYAWTLGEMQYYRRRNEGHLVIKTFVEHFLLEGVPKAQVMKLSDAVSDGQPGVRRTPSTLRITGYDPGQMHRAKSWMGSEHRALVWEVLISNTKTQRAVWDLYRLMIEILSQHHAQRAVSSERVETLPLLGPEVFMTFLKRLSFGSGVVDTLLRDMLRLDVQPTSQVYGHVLYIWARTGYRQRVLRMLRAIHGQYGQNAKPDSLNAHQQSKRDDDDRHSMLQKQVDSWSFDCLEFPPPDVAMYVLALRGFIERSDLDGAVATAGALGRLMGIKNIRRAHEVRKAPGNEELDHWLNGLEDLIRQKGREAQQNLKTRTNEAESFK